MEWGLVHAYSKFDPKTSIDELSSVFNVAAQIDELRREEIILDTSAIQEACSALHVGQAVLSNRDEFLEFIFGIGLRFLNDPKSFNDGFDQDILEISRRLLNLCASFRSYLEHQETFLKRENGRNSVDYQSWRDFLATIENSNKSYALIYGLRNYIQHVDMPPLAISVHSDDRESVTLSLELIRTDLLNPSAQWSSNMRSYLRSVDGNISLYEALEGWDRAFRSILRRNQNLRVLPARGAAERILSLRESYGLPGYGMVGITPMLARPPSDSLTLTITWIEEQKARTVLEICDNLAEQRDGTKHIDDADSHAVSTESSIPPSV